MLKYAAATQHLKKPPNLRFLIIIYAIMLIPLSFFSRGMIVGLLGLPLVTFTSIAYPNKGGLISATWSSCVMILAFLVSPYEISYLPVIGGSAVYFLLALGLERHASLIRRNQVEINLKTEALIREKKQFETLFKSSFNAIVLLDNNHLIIDANQNFIQLFEHKLEDIKGTNIDDILDEGKDGSSGRELTQKLISKAETIVTESVRYSKSGFPIEVLIKAVPIIIDGETIGGYAIYDDITYRKYYEKQLRYLGYHDQLTDLYNRSFFENCLSELSQKNLYPISIITADLNGLKLINDTIGHQSGDELLKATASILKISVRSSDKVFRIGGDEFAIVLSQTSATDCGEIVNKIKSCIKEYNNSHPIRSVSLSIGASTAKNKDITLQEVFKRADDLMYREKLYEGTSVRAQLVNALMATLAERDQITEGHAQRLDDLCVEMGKRSGLPPHRLANLTLLAQVHDLGKVGIPDSILNKPGKLTEKEWEIMRLHPEKGYRIALSSPDLSGVADLILKHHERWDGTGYPLGLKETQIPLECRILTIVDSFDAMTNDRPYSKAKSKEEAIAEIKRCSGTQFDPTLVEIFLSLL
jgi:diguanylate cyclase (GGDEF)-like protein/PAS domain S-box-containing protein